jgi:hypothetical protein
MWIPRIARGIGRISMASWDSRLLKEDEFSRRVTGGNFFNSFLGGWTRLPGRQDL